MKNRNKILLARSEPKQQNDNIEKYADDLSKSERIRINSGQNSQEVTEFKVDYGIDDYNQSKQKANDQINKKQQRLVLGSVTAQKYQQYLEDQIQEKQKLKKQQQQNLQMLQQTQNNLMIKEQSDMTMKILQQEIEKKERILELQQQSFRIKKSFNQNFHNWLKE